MKSHSELKAEVKTINLEIREAKRNECNCKIKKLKLLCLDYSNRMCKSFLKEIKATKRCLA